jgi:hypothetical protein
VGSSLPIGHPYIPNPPTSFGAQPTSGDLTFQYSVPGVGTRNGAVEYTGPQNNLVLTIDPSTGQAAIQNESPFFDVSIDAYTITSKTGRLLTANGTWSSLDDQNLSNWDQADNSNSTRLSEFDPQGSTFLPGGGTILNLGSPDSLASGVLSVDDFTFQFALASGPVMFGAVRFGALPTAALAGDYDHSGVVNSSDYEVWRATFGQAVAAGSGADGNGNGTVDSADYVIWRRYLGGGSATNAAIVPEPQAILLSAILATMAIGPSRSCHRICN